MKREAELNLLPVFALVCQASKEFRPALTPFQSIVRFTDDGLKGKARRILFYSTRQIV